MIVTFLVIRTKSFFLDVRLTKVYHLDFRFNGLISSIFGPTDLEWAPRQVRLALWHQRRDVRSMRLGGV